MKNYKLFAIIFIFFGLIFLSLPNFNSNIDGKKITLGLDIQGGIFLTYELEQKDIMKNYLENIRNNMKYYSEQNNIKMNKNITINENILIVSFENKEQAQQIESLIKDKFNNVEISLKQSNIEIVFIENKLDELYIEKTNKAIEVIKNRLDKFGLSEPSVFKKGTNQIIVEIAGINSIEEETRIQELIEKVSKLEMFAVEENIMEELKLKYQYSNEEKYNSLNDELFYYSNLGYKTLKDKNIEDMGYVLSPFPLIDGNMLKNASVEFDQFNNSNISFELDYIGAEKFADFTGKNVGKRIAISLDNEVYAAPVVNERIGGGKVNITGNFSTNEAIDLAVTLKSGSLPAKLNLLEERKIGPTLGEENIKYSIYALVSGFLSIIIFMIFYYGISGLVANFALIFNLFTILVIMSLFEATLTIPGMAGIILTIGMAVDANIIINERIKEHLLTTKDDILNSIKNGYENAFNSILDANITTFLAALVLFNLGTGAVKGFALTIAIGILTSMISSIYITRILNDFLISLNLDKYYFKKYRGQK